MTDNKKPREIRARLEQADIDRRQQHEGSMRSRGIYLSDNERADLQAIDDKYSPLLDAALQEEQAASGRTDTKKARTRRAQACLMCQYAARAVFNALQAVLRTRYTLSLPYAQKPARTPCAALYGYALISFSRSRNASSTPKRKTVSLSKRIVVLRPSYSTWIESGWAESS